MARNAGKLTMAIRGLLNKDASISHAQAQPKLAKLGFDVVERPEMSEDLKLFREHGKSLDMDEKGNYIGCNFKGGECIFDKDAFEKLVASTGLGRNRGNAVLKEIMVRAAYDFEVNNFNVVKHNWMKMNEKPKVAEVNPPPKHAPKPVSASKPTSKKLRGRPKKKVVNPTIVVDGDFTPTTALEYIESQGGLNKVKARVSDIDAEIKALQAEQVAHNDAISTLETFQKAIREAA